MYGSYREKGRNGEERVQNPELSCVSTSSKTPHTNINSFVFNVFQLISGGVAKGDMERNWLSSSDK